MPQPFAVESAPEGDTRIIASPATKSTVDQEGDVVTVPAVPTTTLPTEVVLPPWRYDSAKFIDAVGRVRHHEYQVGLVGMRMLRVMTRTTGKLAVMELAPPKENGISRSVAAVERRPVANVPVDRSAALALVATVAKLVPLVFVQVMTPVEVLSVQSPLIEVMPPKDPLLFSWSCPLEPPGVPPPPPEDGCQIAGCPQALNPRIAISAAAMNILRFFMAHTRR